MAEHKIDGNDGAGNVDLIRRIDAMQACQVGPSDEWAKATKDGYNQAATDCAMAILRVAPVSAANDEMAIPESETDYCIGLRAQLAAATARADQAYEDAASFIEETAYVPEKHHRYDCADKIRSLRDKPAPVVTVRDSFAGLIADARTEAEKAMKKFPQPNYVLLKVAEEAGEVVKAGVHFAEGRETRENVKSEMRQTIAMLYRLWVEGDQVNGVPPIAPPEA